MQRVVDDRERHPDLWLRFSVVDAPPELVAKLKEVTATTALGDSVPYGTACDCTPYPQLVGADVAHAAGHPVRITNAAVAGSRER